MKAKILLPIVLFAFWATGCYTQFEAQQQPKVEKEVVIVERETEPDIVVNEGDTTFVYDDENESEVEISVKKYTYIEDDYWSRPVVRVNLIAGYMVMVTDTAGITFVTTLIGITSTIRMCIIHAGFIIPGTGMIHIHFIGEDTTVMATTTIITTIGMDFQITNIVTERSAQSEGVMAGVVLL